MRQTNQRRVHSCSKSKKPPFAGHPSRPGLYLSLQLQALLNKELPFSAAGLWFTTPPQEANTHRAMPGQLSKGKRGMYAPAHRGETHAHPRAHQPRDLIVCYTVMAITVSFAVSQMLLVRRLPPAPLQFRVSKQPLKTKCSYREEKRDYRIFPKQQRSIRFATRNRKTLEVLYNESSTGISGGDNQ